jgi:alginate O-acetyltransferase complex protein AlgI
LWLIALGATKKALVADRLAVIVDLSFTHLVRAGSWDLWLATLAYGLQLYLDFSGYVDIVRGSAILLGLTLPENFEDPYFTTSIADFWRRWHMTLGNWLRNYLYFPLGGSRLGLFRTCFNLLMVMLIAGIWHGAAWGFIVWGVYHGLALVVHRLIDSISKTSYALKSFWKSLPGTVLAWLMTQLMVFTAWIFFRLPNLKDSWFAISHLWGKEADPQFTQKIYLDTLGIDRLQFTWILFALVGVMTLLFLLQRRLNLQLNWPIKLVLIPVSLYLVWLLAPQGALPYIYFDF